MKKKIDNQQSIETKSKQHLVHEKLFHFFYQSQVLADKFINVFGNATRKWNGYFKFCYKYLVVFKKYIAIIEKCATSKKIHFLRINMVFLCPTI